MKKLTLLLFLFFIVVAANAQDKIVKTNGETIKCKIIEVGTSEIKYIPADNLTGPSYSIAREKVAKIEIERAQQEIKSSTEYKQLKTLFESGILTKEEFDVKVMSLKVTTTPHKIETEYKKPQNNSIILKQLFNKTVYRIRFSLGYLLIIFSIFSFINHIIIPTDFNSLIFFINSLILLLGLLLVTPLYRFIVNMFRIKNK